MNFDDLFNRYHWKTIRNCPGRYVLTDAPLDLKVEELLGVELEPREFRVEAARDRVMVTLLQSGGVISYLRPDGSCVHRQKPGQIYFISVAAFFIPIETSLWGRQ